MSEPNEDIANQESQSLVVVTEGQQNADNNGQPPNASENAKKEVVMPKKRKEMEPRSEVWDSFTKIMEGDVLKRGKCNYCKRELKCETKINGTSALNSHLKICKKNPNRNTDDKQPTLQATRNEGDGSKCTLTAWRFDPEMLRKAFVEMMSSLLHFLRKKDLESLCRRHAHVLMCRLGEQLLGKLLACSMCRNRS